MEHWLWIILAALFFECKGEDRVNQTTGDVIATEGHTLTLDCTFETSYPNPTLFWYKQEVHDYPKSILQRYSGAKDAGDVQKDRIDARVDKKSVPLRIQKLQLSDSAVYYCALRALGEVVEVATANPQAEGDEPDRDARSTVSGAAAVSRASAVALAGCVDTEVDNFLRDIVHPWIQSRQTGGKSTRGDSPDRQSWQARTSAYMQHHTIRQDVYQNCSGPSFIHNVHI
ncbi:uncharacterized protein LOC119497855 [Sebastes umbrosus]|uniref:uncharacterized protein LOC119497855 n=1 Tax=Sebastes umbrosus TaxID=72105 RepID=UPI0018A03B76|nr:uncharacterized protein LOC119497855 [Sebastes umbrosus]